MSAAGDAVLAVARGEVGVTEYPSGSNRVKYWIPWTGSEDGYGPWCAAFASWCVNVALGPGAMCPVDGAPGFVLVSNGTIHSYETAGDGATGVEAQRTVDLQPGDVVLFSWYSWIFQGGVPIITDPEWAGYVAGDHTGIVATAPDAAGWFRAVEGNTSTSSWDNGGAVMERDDRHISQVCGWWRPVNYDQGSGPEPPKGWLDMLTDQQQADLYNWAQATYWQVGNFMPAAGVPSLLDRIAALEQRLQSVYWMVGNQDPEAGAPTVAGDARAARENTERLLEGT